ncbi:MAG: phenylacetate-CoA oxygenase subunit PaaC [Gammaproteobacteria bacterium]|nr:phenylacetate-CoA oxygenase subunit PaaC [Gammaproteobacteria bacterium]
MGDKKLDDQIAEYALRLGDDALVFGQRLCEWCADAPTLEEDIAISNVGLDYLGRARMALQYAGKTLGRTEDELAFLRDSGEFRNLLLVELPRGDFAFSMVRQYLLDEFELLFFTQLCGSKDDTLGAIAAKTVKEVRYHQRRSANWMQRLGLGTQESQARTQAAIDQLWGYMPELFEMDELETSLLQAGIAVDRLELHSKWLNTVTAQLASANLQIPQIDWQVVGGRKGVHTEHLGHMLGEMQFLQRAYPGLQW